MNIKEITLQIRQNLNTKSPTPDLDADLILSHILKRDKLDLVLNQDYILSSKEIERIDKCVEQRLNKIPIAYIIGHKEFYGRSFVVNSDVLIPRPETEEIIQITKSVLSNIDLPNIWEIGTGSGCIAITLAAEISQAKVIASDISKQSLLVAKKNAIMLLGEKNNITWLDGDLLDPFQSISSEPNIIIANLPYLDQNKYQDDSILFEPNLALYSSYNGLEHYIRLFQEIKSRFIVYPKILIEINPEQTEILGEHIKEQFKSKVHIYKDLQGLDRHILIEPF